MGKYLARRPKTVLGFFGAGIGFVIMGLVFITKTLALVPELFYLVPWVLAISAVIVVGIVAVVAVIAWNRPAHLQIGQVSGDAFLTYLRQGDTRTGEFFEAVRVDVQVSGPLPLPLNGPTPTNLLTGPDPAPDAEEDT